MKSLLLLALMILSLQANIYETVSDSRDFNEKQKLVILNSYNYALYEDLGYTLAAIAIVESSAGEIRVNISDPSFGIHHNLVSSVVNRLGMTDTCYNRNKVASRLVTDDDFSREQALQELLFWRKYHSNNWRLMVMSYNAGHKYQNGQHYLNKVIYWISVLKGN
jgi:hypothetical protein